MEHQKYQDKVERYLSHSNYRNKPKYKRSDFVPLDTETYGTGERGALTQVSHSDKPTYFAEEIVPSYCKGGTCEFFIKRNCQLVSFSVGTEKRISVKKAELVLDWHILSVSVPDTEGRLNFLGNDNLLYICLLCFHQYVKVILYTEDSDTKLYVERYYVGARKINPDNHLYQKVDIGVDHYGIITTRLNILRYGNGSCWLTFSN